MMNRILITIAIACFSLMANAQSIFKKEANWIDQKNGVSYEMNIYSKSAKNAGSDLAKIKFTIDGDLTLLEKVSLMLDGKLKMNVPLKAEANEIELQPGVYTFKIYHKIFSEKDFEVELKKAQQNNIKLTIKKIAS
ncbi:hypothetical protein [Pedobacter aquatilis]|uniref:hypothetical protein n=1 Tax=Pedobacter aquatilis TaxID=351343 RepID=UPI00292EFA83|nr:hypothetical protein [Pedobacter aquatilis]